MPRQRARPNRGAPPTPQGMEWKEKSKNVSKSRIPHPHVPAKIFWCINERDARLTFAGVPLKRRFFVHLRGPSAAIASAAPERLNAELGSDMSSSHAKRKKKTTARAPHLLIVPFVYFFCHCLYCLYSICYIWAISFNRSHTIHWLSSFPLALFPSNIQ